MSSHRINGPPLRPKDKNDKAVGLPIDADKDLGTPGGTPAAAAWSHALDAV